MARFETGGNGDGGEVPQIGAGTYGVEVLGIDEDGPSPNPQYAKNGSRFKWHFVIRKVIYGDDDAEGKELPWQWTSRRLSPPTEKFGASKFYDWAKALLATDDFAAANFQDTDQLIGLKAIATVTLSGSGRANVSELMPLKGAKPVRLPDPQPVAVGADEDGDELF